MDFFKSARQAAERAAEVAKAASQKGMALAGGAAEQAAKSLTKFNIHEKIGAGHAKEEEVTEQDLEAVGINGHYINTVSELHFSTFRDFPKEQLLPLPPESESENIFVLNPWQLRHAKLVCHAVKEMRELRFMLCPKYMTDERFWHIYFSIMKPELPAEAFMWTAPAPGGDSKDTSAEADMVQGVLHELKSTWQTLEQGVAKTRASMAARPAPAAQGVEMAPSALPRAPLDVPLPPAPAEAPEEPNAAPSGLGIDPDLEAYLQVDEGDAGDDTADLPDMDFDDYLNELAGPEEEEEGGEEIARDTNEEEEKKKAKSTTPVTHNTKAD